MDNLLKHCDFCGEWYGGSYCHCYSNPADIDEARRQYMAAHAKAAARGIETRLFETGASRDTDVGKLDYEGFLSPLVLKRFAEYMHEKRKMPDGSVRDGDNWQKGMPEEVYMKSLLRHVMTVWNQQRAYGTTSNDDLCAILFNVQGLLFEQLKKWPKA